MQPALSLVLPLRLDLVKVNAFFFFCVNIISPVLITDVHRLHSVKMVRAVVKLEFG